MTLDLEASYDLVPYPAFTHFHTRLDRLHAIGGLFGMAAPPVEHSRVLELGCGTGMNLLSLAFRNPDAHFLGLDLSGDQIRQAKEAAGVMGLQNVEFRHQSLTEFREDSCSYDYILAHGVFSWVPTEVRLRILQICRDHLSPNGIAYISYNTLPGWFQNLWMRDMMTFASKGEEGSRKLAKAKAFLAMAGQSAALDGNLKAFLQKKSKGMEQDEESYLLHDFLEITNQPMYFREFMELASGHGLRYLADAEFNHLLQDDFPAALAFSAPGEDRLRQEQLSDFLQNRTFRRSLLCRAEVSLDLAPSADRIKNLFAVGFLRPEPKASPSATPGATWFADINGKGGLLIGPSALNVALTDLDSNFPRAVSVRDLLVRARAKGFPEDEQRFSTQLLSLWGKGYLDLLPAPTRLPDQRGERPTASPIARYQALHSGRLTNLEHGHVNILDGIRNLIPYIDGTRTEGELAAKALEVGIIPFHPQLNPSQRLQNALTEVRRFLDWCLGNALLVD